MSFETRKSLYQEIKSELTEFGTEEIEIHDTDKNKEYEITNHSEILTLFKKMLREKLLFRIKGENSIYLNNNRITLVKDKFISLTNPFILFAEGSFPEIVEVNFEDDGIDYTFKLEKFKSSGIEKEIYCLLPNNIKVLKRRGIHRVKSTLDIPVGIYSNENDQEYIGSLNDISELGIGIKFNSNYFDDSFYNRLKSMTQPRVPIILEINGEYLTIVISIKFLTKNENNEIIIGAEFVFTEEEKNLKIKEFVDKIRKNAIFQKKKELSEHLIFIGEMGV